MALPRIFVSSTFYDLRFVRADLAILEEHIGVEVVRFETGAVPYHTAETLPEACCKEIDNCHILVSVIGGRYGSVVAQPSESADGRSSNRSISISRLEVERAVKSGLLLFAFVEADVYALHPTYLNNRSMANKIVWPSVDDIRVFEFIEYIHNLPGRNPIFPFRTPREIQDMLRVQLAGLFCDLLQREKLDKYSSHLDQVIASAERLQNLQLLLSAREAEAERRIRETALPDDEIYGQLQAVLGLDFRIFFKNREELKRLLSAHGFGEVDRELREEFRRERYYYYREKPRLFIGILKSCFSDPDGNVVETHADDVSKLVWSGRTLPGGGS
jgi:Domain of unknown function (DUF4062)